LLLHIPLLQFCAQNQQGPVQWGLSFDQCYAGTCLLLTLTAPFVMSVAQMQKQDIYHLPACERQELADLSALVDTFPKSNPGVGSLSNPRTSHSLATIALTFTPFGERV
jgi:hypothetical protein